MNIFNSAKFLKADLGKTLSFFHLDESIIVDDAIIDALFFEGRDRNCRICLHPSPDASFHEMIILERPHSYFPPHRHPTKGESCHIIHGELAVLTFDDKGALTSGAVLGDRGNYLSRVSTGQWHMTIPLTNPTIYHEAKPGPFLGSADREFASWAPGQDDAAARAYVEQLIGELR